jgi:hypothetical protein
MDSYRNALSVLEIREWPELLTNLESPNVLEALNLYVSAYKAGMVAVNAHDDFDEHVWPTPTTQAVLEAHWTKAAQLRHERIQSRRTQRMAWRKLITLL